MIGLAWRPLRALTAVVVAVFLLLLPPPAQAEEGKSGVTANKVKLPSGPGSLEGVGENAEPNISMGIVSYGVPIALPAGYNGLSPSLRLGYSSAGGASEVGMGWSLPIPKIERMTSRGLPRYSAVDLFAANDGEELVRLPNTDYFRARYEGGFVRYSWLSAPDGKKGFWMAEYPDGKKGYFGATAQGQLVDAARVETANGTYAYMLVELADTLGHKVVYSYNKPPADGRPYLSGIAWAFNNDLPRYTATLKYEARVDVLSDGKPGQDIRLSQRVSDIEVRVRNQLLRRYHLSYEAPTATGGFTRLAEVQTFGALNDVAYPISFRFSYTGTFDPVCAANAECLKPFVKSLGAVGVDFKAGTADLIDINDDHLPDVVNTRDGVHHFYIQKLSMAEQSFYPVKVSAMAGSGSMLLNAPAVRMVDLDANGSADMIDGLNKRILFNNGAGDWNVGMAFDAQLPDFSADANLRFLDVNYDRYIDVVHIDPSGAWFFENTKDNRFAATATVMNLSGVGFVQNALQLADFNGDGIQDLVQPLSGGVAYRMNLGHGNFSAPIEVLGLPSTWTAADTEFVDLNGDGLSDAVVVLGNTVQYCLNQNGRAFGAVQLISDATGGIPARTPEMSLRFADMNASGSTDIVWITPSGAVSYLELFPRRPNLLSKVENGIGKVIEAHYGTSAEHMARDGGPDAWELRLPNVMITLDQLVTYDTLSNVRQVQSFRYKNGFFDGKEHQFRGFRDVEVTTAGDPSMEEGRSIYRFEVGEKDGYRKGLLLSQEIQSAGRSLKLSESTYEDCPVAEVAGTPLPVRFICSTKSEDELREGLPKEQWVRTRTTMAFDGYGNVTSKASEGVVSVGGGACGACVGDPAEMHGQYCGQSCLGDEAFSETTFIAPSTSTTAGQWLLRAPQREISYGVAGAVAGKLPYTEALTYYDGADFEGLPLGQLTVGLAKRKTQKVLASANDVIATESSALDAHGNVLVSRDANGRQREFGYDADSLLLLHEDVVFNDPNRAEHYKLRQALTYHPLYEQPISSTAWMRVVGTEAKSEPRATAYDYDQFSRLVKIAKPGDTLDVPTQEFLYELLGPTSRIIARTRSQAGAEADLEAIQCFDGLGRKLQQKDRIRSGEYQVSGFSVFNIQGKESQSFQPYQSPAPDCAVQAPTGTSPSESTKFDALGRPLEHTRPDENEYPQYSKTPSRVRTVYLPLATVAYDAEDEEPLSPHFDTPTTTHVDGQGRTIRIERLLAKGGKPIVTTFGFDTLGHLNRLVDDHGNVKTQVYDLLGRVLSVTDPDTGVTTFTHDKVGNVLTETDSRKVTVTTTYDEANRPVARFDAANPNTTKSEWFYDSYPGCQDCTYGEGQLVATRFPLPENYSGSRVGEDRFGFDVRARARFFSRTLVNHEFRFTFEFDNADRPAATTYPNNVRLASTLDGLSRATKIEGRAAGAPAATEFVKSITYNQRSLLETMTLGNNTVTTHEYDNVLRLRRLSTDLGQQKIQGYLYNRDRADNLLGITDERVAEGPSATADYGYDALYRLKTATLDKGRPSAENLGFDYDTIDNILSKTSELGAKSSTHVGGYKYAEFGAGPHAVSQAGEHAYRYDSAGNMTLRKQQHMKWDHLGRMVRADLGAENLGTFGYDTGRQRVTKQEGASLTLYVAPDFEVRDGVSTLYVAGPGGKIAKIETADMAVTLLGDTAPAGALDANVTAGDAYLAIVGGDAQVGTAALASSARRSLLEMGQRITYLHHNHLGSAAVTTDESGTVVQRTEHYPYGEVRYQSEFLEDYSFTGQEKDARTALSYHSARYLDVGLGRWVSADPLFGVAVLPRAMGMADRNVYGYVGGRLLALTDPSGQEGTDVAFSRKLGPLTIQGKLSTPTFGVKVDLKLLKFGVSFAQASMSASAEGKLPGTNTTISASYQRWAKGDPEGREQSFSVSGEVGVPESKFWKAALPTRALRKALQVKVDLGLETFEDRMDLTQSLSASSSLGKLFKLNHGNQHRQWGMGGEVTANVVGKHSFGVGSNGDLTYESSASGNFGFSLDPTVSSHGAGIAAKTGTSQKVFDTATEPNPSRRNGGASGSW